MSRERYSRLGIPQGYWQHAKHFEARARDWGMSAADIEAHLAWGANLDRGSPDELADAYVQFAQSRGLDNVMTDLSLSWHGQVNERGIEAMPQDPSPPVTQSDRARLEEIRDEMKKDRRDSLYWKPNAAGEAMRDEYLGLIERLGNKANDPAPPVRSSADDATRAAEIRTMIKQEPHKYFNNQRVQDEFAGILQRAEQGESIIHAPDPSRDVARKEELQEMMKQGSGGNYWGGPHAELNQIEYREIIEREGPTQSEVTQSYETN